MKKRKSKSNTRICITNWGMYHENEESVEEWLPLPCSNKQLTDLLQRIEIDDFNYHRYVISDCESDFDCRIAREDDNVMELSALIERVEALNNKDYRKLKSLTDSGEFEFLDETFRELDEAIIKNNKEKMSFALNFQVKREIEYGSIAMFNWQGREIREMLLRTFANTKYSLKEYANPEGNYYGDFELKREAVEHVVKYAKSYEGVAWVNNLEGSYTWKEVADYFRIVLNETPKKYDSIYFSWTWVERNGK